MKNNINETKPYEFKTYHIDDQELNPAEEQLVYTLDKLAYYNDFQSVWCDYDSLKEDNKVPKSIRYISDYRNQVRVYLCEECEYEYIDLWPFCEQLYLGIGAWDHKFIEGFDNKGDHLEVFFGS